MLRFQFFNMCYNQRMFLIDVFYFFILLIFIPIVPKYIFKKEYRELLKKRLNPPILNKSVKKRIWIHSVSVGEVKSLNKLLIEISKHDDMEIILSVTTPSGYKIAKEEYKSIKIIMAPIDFSFTVKKFIKAIKPKILILNELELWPNWLIITKKYKIPIVLINGRISTTAMTKYRRFIFILKYFLNKIDLFLLQAEIYKKRFLKLGAKENRIKICGNIKADEALNISEELPKSSSIIDFLKINNRHKKIITLASSHKSDEEIFLPIISSLNAEYSVILVPRHTDRISQITEGLDNFKINYKIWSKSKSIDLTKSVLIFDKMGYMFKILYISDLIIMGGTFSEKIGGHNLYEPAILGKRIIGGKYYNNFPDIGEKLEELSVYKTVKDSKEMLETIKSISDDLDNKEIRKNSEEAVLKRRGSVESIINEINKILQ